MIDLRCQLQHVERNFHIHVALDPALAGLGVGKFTGQFAHDRIAIVVEPVDQRTKRRVFLVFGEGGVIIGADEPCIPGEMGAHPGIVDIHAERARCGVKVGSVNEQYGLFVGDLSHNYNIP